MPAADGNTPPADVAPPKVFLIVSGIPEIRKNWG
jgi:hypothetical protein